MAGKKPITPYGEATFVTADAGVVRGIDNEPELVLLYGPVGAGKTTATLRTSANCLWIAPPGGTKPYKKALGGYRPETHVADNWGLEELIEFLPQVASRKNAQGQPFDGVVIDDGSLVADVSYQRMKRSEGVTYEFWDRLKALFIQFRQTARSCGLHVITNFHEKGPKDDANKGFQRGGPLLPMRDLIETIPATFDLVARCTTDPSMTGTFAQAAKPGEWAGVFMVDRAQTQWLTKDRDGICPPLGPPNLRQILSLARYKFALPPGLECMDELVAIGAQALLDGHDEQAVNQQVADQLVQKLQGKPDFDNERIFNSVEWALTDVRDRATLMRYQLAKLERFGVQLTL